MSHDNQAWSRSTDLRVRLRLFDPAGGEQRQAALTVVPRQDLAVQLRCRRSHPTLVTDLRGLTFLFVYGPLGFRRRPGSWCPV